ncbi:Coenzyme F420 hydrogenase/dehydrogenase, beta subunit C-terminal domain [Phenylobacterium sp.]|uniref:Coenzyme F420 hydrogenase/dehydrogenase, beta subunit C-terminal domain n=1 Tax=Phenylobacterium sp. TaxID=1871053 RepID=UPI0025EBDD9A|nr:Coenzyme F420 hydrogenase/dehydrogenase, beta subunit C-terminal domain [Phenylobacterium sp.]
MQPASAKSPTVTRVLNGELCTGCGLCAALAPQAIRMESAPPGYARPLQIGGVTPETERRIADSCPGAVVEPWQGAPNTHPTWGPWRRVMTGASTDPKVRFEASSGGAISGLLIHALESGLVDRVLHIAPDPADPTRNVNAISRSGEEILARAGSRYTASSPLAAIEQALADGGAMAFVGKPCDVSALRRLARQDARVARHVPIVLSFFCGGMPSHGGVGRILNALGVPAEEVVEFRYRGRGWPGACVARSERRTAEMSYADSWGSHLSKEVQFRCKICPDAVGGVADIACADAWYGDEEGYPSFEEQEGRSLIVTRTEAGDRLIDSALAAGRIEAEPLPIEEVGKMQPSQARRKRLILARTAALPLTLQPRPRMRGLRVAQAAREASLADAARNLLGTIRRTLKGTRSRL